MPFFIDDAFVLFWVFSLFKKYWRRKNDLGEGVLRTNLRLHAYTNDGAVFPRKLESEQAKYLQVATQLNITFKMDLGTCRYLHVYVDKSTL